MRDGVSAIQQSRPRNARTGAVRAAALGRTAAVVLLALWAVLGTLAAQAMAVGTGDQVVKVFVVPDPAQDGGVPATLQSVASSTLGDAGRAGEIFDLNRGLAQADGAVLTSEDEQLHPGWILRLPQDAAGPDVKLARDTASQGGSSAPSVGGGTNTTVGGSAAVTIPLPAAIAAAVAVLLALVTVGIVGRRRVRAASAVMGHAVRRLGGGVGRRRRLAARRAVSQRFAADAGTVRRAYAAVAGISSTGAIPGRPVHALRVDEAGVTAWLAPGDAPGAPWAPLDGAHGTRWRRAAAHSHEPRTTDSRACLVRVGVDADGEAVLYDLSRLDGVLSVTGDYSVARDVVHGLLEEVARSRPGTPVTVLHSSDHRPPLELPAGLQPVVRVEQQGEPVRDASREERGTVRGAAARRPVKGLVVMAGTPTEREATELAALCGPGGAGWTGLVCGEVGGAHWRWRAEADGVVDIPVLGIRLTVPA